MTKAQKTNREQHIEVLRKQLTPGQTVYTKLNHVSKSGMGRVIDVYIMENNEPSRISWAVAQAIDARYDTKHEGVYMGGCGMDMGFALVYNLSRVLFQGRFECIGQGCPSNDHSNGDRDQTPHTHKDGGYALQQRWL